MNEEEKRKEKEEEKQEEVNLIPPAGRHTYE